jgi:hypothetical protein
LSACARAAVEKQHENNAKPSAGKTAAQVHLRYRIARASQNA